jgi:hypothetical protein
MLSIFDNSQCYWINAFLNIQDDHGVAMAADEEQIDRVFDNL